MAQARRPASERLAKAPAEPRQPPPDAAPEPSLAPDAVPLGDVVVVDDDEDLRRTLDRVLTREGFRVRVHADGASALADVEANPTDLVVTDLVMPGLSGQDVLRAARARDPGIQVVFLTGYASVPEAVTALKGGAHDFLVKPVAREELLRVLRRALERRRLESELKELREHVGREEAFAAAVGRSRAWREVLDLVDRIAASSATVLLYGESGTGKEVVARALHARSPRRPGPFVAVHCAALPESLLEAELFGHERGAFTGASGRRAGRFEEAHGGTLFLDEVGEVSLAVQGKLLRALQERRVRRLGGERDVAVDIRVIAATNRDLDQAVAAGTFREDLFYRLKVIDVRLPPLREREGDVALLAARFLAHFARRNGRAIEGFDEEALDVLERHDWPGNVRELENAIERAVILCAGPRVGLRDLPPLVRAAARKPRAAPRGRDLGLAIPPDTPLARAERLVIEDALARHGGDKERAARALGIASRTIYRKLKEWEKDRG